MAEHIVMMDAPCDRCGKQERELRPYKLTSSITFRGKVIEFPWLCWKCFRAEKKKWWATAAAGAGMSLRAPMDTTY